MELFSYIVYRCSPPRLITLTVYKDAAAVAHHRETPHFKAWAEFKAAGGVLSQEVIKAIAVDFTY
jgi:quinol monooxygenase YgiN